MTDSSSGVLTPMFRASYAHLFKPQTNDEGKEVYSVVMVFEPDEDLSELKKLAKRAKIAKFGKDFKGKVKSPFRKGTEEEFDLEKNPVYRDKVIVSARSYGEQPSIVDTKRQPIIDSKEVYSGSYGIAYISAYAYEFKGNRGVSFGLEHYMKVKDGEPLISRVPVGEAFAAAEIPDDIDLEEDDFDDFDDDDDF